MGFEVPKRTARMVFEEYPELEAVCSLDASLETFLKYQDIEDDPQKLKAAMLQFGDEVLVSWNLTQEGKPVPATGSGLLSLPLTFVSQIMNAYVRTVQEVSPPLADASPNGNTSLAPLMPKATKLQNLRS